MIKVISLGAGVQSTTMALMAAKGEIGSMPDCAIFADTGAEPEAVYRHLKWLVSPSILPFPVHIVSVGNLRLEILKATRGEGKRGSHARPPFFVLNPDGSRGMVRRQCTGDYKIDPIEKKVRELIGLRPRQHWPKVEKVEQWIGISTDEAMRMKPSRRAAVRMRWPLIEQGMSRSDCLLWMEKHGYSAPPKSACTFCPYHSNETWRHLRDTDPKGWSEAVEIDAAIRNGLMASGLRGQLFVHASRVPLEQVDLSTREERAIDQFNNDCEGMCGV